MNTISVDFNKGVGKVKPMHATNNGPAISLATYEASKSKAFKTGLDKLKAGKLHPYNNNLEEFKKAGIPYARTHDSSHCSKYGLEHTVDVYYIFPNFDLDPYDPNNYDFACTDHYLLGCELAGVEVFYRLGHRIEHTVKKYGINPPADFKKWAIICEHIIRHYTQGWANGYNMNITYWEIWNEPDLWMEDPSYSPTWSGTTEQFYEFYDIVATHLKECFPNIKVGGPALCGNLKWAEDFLLQLKGVPLDFFSWHIYACKVEGILDLANKINALLEKCGYGNVESILNEWNYIRSWDEDDIVYSLDQCGKAKGASFSSAVMCACQYAPVDMLMYYDARPNSGFNGMFDRNVIGKVLKGYYPFVMFNDLYRLGECVETTINDENVYACSAKNDDNGAILVTHYNDDDGAKEKAVSIDITDFGSASGVEVEFFVLDETRDMKSVGKAVYYGDRFGVEIVLPNYTCYLIKLKKK